MAATTVTGVRHERSQHDGGHALTLAARQQALHEAVERRMAEGAPAEVQTLLADLLDQLRRLVDARARVLVPPVETAVRGLLGATPNLALARAVHAHTARALRRRYRVVPLVSGLLLGLVVFNAAYVWTFAVQGPRQGFLGFDAQVRDDVALVVVVGALSATVSMMLRIRNYAGLRTVDSEVLLYTAFFKPLVGAAFALFVYLALESGIVTITTPPDAERFLLGALAFVAGFSERFAKDVISRVAQEGSEPDDAAAGLPHAAREVEESETVQATSVVLAGDGALAAGALRGAR